MTAIDPSNFSRNRRAMITLRPEIDSFAGDLSLHTCFERTIEQEPGTAKAHFNLAHTCEQLGLVQEAQCHWLPDLDLGPAGEWAAIAREHLVGALR
jgi:hypothetical protein